MAWLQRYRLRHFLRSSFWFVPVCCLAAAVLVLPIVRWIDYELGWPWFNFTPDGARAVLGSLSASMLTFIVFALSAQLLVVQLACAQLTARIIALAMSSRLSKVSVGVFAFSYTFALGALGRIEDRVPQLSVCIAVLANLVSIALFFRYVQQLAVSLRPVSMLQVVTEEGQEVIDSVYPEPFDSARPQETSSRAGALPARSRTIPHAGTSGALLAFSTAGLVALARKVDCTIELVPQVGDFVSRADPLFRVDPPEAAVDETALHQTVAFGPERTLEQDPGFAFRILVDIAARALSPAINDPTTAVLAIDQIHRLLRDVGTRQLDAGRVQDKQGQLRLVYPTPKWEDFVTLAVSEIRLFGASSLQIPRRLCAMLEHLIEVLPASRAAALRQELILLHRAVERDYPDAEDRLRAETGDRQGVGGFSPVPASQPDQLPGDQVG